MYVLLKSYEELDKEYGIKLPFEMSRLLGKAHKAIYNKYNKTWLINGYNFPKFFIKQFYESSEDAYLTQKFNEILDLIPIKLDDNSFESLYEILEEIYANGYCDGNDNYT